jgi:hypothetical protein
MWFISTSKVPKSFQLVNTDATTWEKHYVDKTTNIEWVEYYPYEEDRSPEFIRRADFPVELHDMLSVCVQSPDTFDWYGLGAHLSAKKYHIDELLDYFEKNKHVISRKALKEFGKAYRPRDTRNTNGMNYQQICESYEAFKQAVERIKEITK